MQLILYPVFIGEKGEIMNKKILAVFSVCLLVSACISCSSNNTSSVQNDLPEQEISDAMDSPTEKATEKRADPIVTEPETRPPSPREKVVSQMGTQINIDEIVSRDAGSNTLLIPLSDFIEDGDVISSFTFIIYSGDGADIGEFKGGCGISVGGSCPSATDEGWFQSEDFSAPTQGTYGEITWEVPGDIRDYIANSGKVLFGYWWGGSTSVRLESVICTYTRTKDIPVDGSKDVEVNKSVNYDAADNTIKVPLKDVIPDEAIVQTVTYNISSGGRLGKFTGAFGVSAGDSYIQSHDAAVFTDASSLSLTWILPEKARKIADNKGDLVLGYWWSEQSGINLDSISVRYSFGDDTGIAVTAPTEPPERVETGFRSAKEVIGSIKVGWNLGNTLDCYDTGNTGIATETGWGNLKTTDEMIKSVQEAGFNAIRIPVTWGEHLDADNRIQKDWMARVQEVVDYAYGKDMYVILNMHHDDYIWFNPTASEYTADSAKLRDIWEQIANHFKNYDDHLIFEGMNEPRTIGSLNEWTGGTSAERMIINNYAQDFVNVVRSTGGNNIDRTLICTTYAASAELSAIQNISVPKDENVAVSIHYYAPWKFANGMSTTFGADEIAELDNKFAQLYNKFISNDIPLIIGEFGCKAAADDNTRAEYYKYYIQDAKKKGIPCFVWDNGQLTGDESYGLFDRASLTWNQTILNGIMNGAKE